MSESHVKSATDRHWPHKANSATSWSFSLPAQAIQGACLAGWPAPASQAALSSPLATPGNRTNAGRELARARHWNFKTAGLNPQIKAWPPRASLLSSPLI